MVYTVNLKWTSWKQDISKPDTMLCDQPATYAVLRYAHDIPDGIYKRAMNLLLANADQIINKKLGKLVKSYAGVAKVGIVMDEEFVESIEVPVLGAAQNENGISLMLVEDDD